VRGFIPRGPLRRAFRRPGEAAGSQGPRCSGTVIPLSSLPSTTCAFPASSGGKGVVRLFLASLLILHQSGFARPQEISQPDEVPNRRIELDLAQAVERRASSGEDEVFSSRSAARAFPSSIQQSDIERLAPAQFLLDEPPLQPAESGDPGYHTVPFQVLR
jgi:hypothetical protein